MHFLFHGTHYSLNLGLSVDNTLFLYIFAATMKQVNKYTPLERPVLTIGIGCFSPQDRFRRQPNRQ